MKNYLLQLIFLCIVSISFGQLRITGYVTEFGTDIPLEKTIVSLNGSDNIVITDKKGYFTIVLKESGVYALEVSKNGFKSLSQELLLNESITIGISLTSNNPHKIHENSSYSSTTNEKKYIDRNEPIFDEKVNKTITETNSKNTSNQSTDREPFKRSKIRETKKSISKTNNLEDLTVVLKGVVRDKFTKKPISNAIISLEGIKNKFATDENGVFNIFVSETGDYEFKIKKDGYILESNKIPVFNNLDLTILMTKIDAQTITTDEVVISGTRATKNTPTTFKKISKEEIAENNLGKDLPYLLELTPSLVASSDGGSGTGYTSMRIRGSDMSRINFTLNGFPVNDAESQGVFLVNTPDLASDINNIQIQRGIGTSTNGAGAFGASININTNTKNTKPYAEFNNSYGSFNTMKNTIKAGTGLLYDHFTIDGRFSHLMTDGYIDRSNAKLFGFALNTAYYNKNSIVRFNVFHGNEVTHQAWNGVDASSVETNRTFNSSGTDFGQKATPYDNEIDNYTQTNYQLALSHQFTTAFSANLGLHYTKGKGYFEQYKVDEDLLEYGIINPGNNTDLVRRRWLDNDFYGTIASLNYKKEKIDATLGGGWNLYDGDHFGEVIWAKDAQDLTKDEVYYNNNGLKMDGNVFLKAEYKFTKRFVAYGDVQYRNVNYDASGIDNDQKQISIDQTYHFVNPKVGLTYILGKDMNSQIYTSFAMATKEPTRNDFIDNDIDPKPENMMDFELGFRHKKEKRSFGVNAFYMKYKDQLVLTGALNDVGSAVRANVENSFRTGIEVDGAYELNKFFGFSAAGTWSLNELDELSIFDESANKTTYSKTKLSYSPSLVANIVLYTKAFKGFKLALINKYVSEQFLDNTSTKEKSLEAYFLNDARVSYSINPKFMQEIELIFKVNNIFNTKYSANGYVYYDTPYFYPQAGTNFEGAINLKF